MVRLQAKPHVQLVANLKGEVELVQGREAVVVGVNRRILHYREGADRVSSRATGSRERRENRDRNRNRRYRVRQQREAE